MLWYQGLDEDFPDSNCRKFIELEFDTKEKVVYCNIATQHKRILQWQNRTPENQKMYWHFRTDIQAHIPDEVSKQHKKYFGSYGGWKFRPSSSKFTLEKTIDFFFIIPTDSFLTTHFY